MSSVNTAVPSAIEKSRVSKVEALKKNEEKSPSNAAILVNFYTRKLRHESQVAVAFETLLELNATAADFESSGTERALKRYLKQPKHKEMAKRLKAKIGALKKAEKRKEQLEAEGKEDCNEIDTPFRDDLPIVIRDRFKKVLSLADRMALFQ